MDFFDYANTKAKKEIKSRVVPLDLIFTISEYDNVWLPIAYNSGWKWGIESIKNCLKPDYIPPYPIVFIDNDYHKYDHNQHLEVVKRFTPKYATVMDIMTKEQCEADKINHCSFEQIIDWAYELKEYAENIIVIPKYDCLDKIPDCFMLGYSVPTSHGGTPLPISAFKGWKTHLLGGSWKEQLNCLIELEDDIVSLDNNYIWKQSKFGVFVDGNGNNHKLTDRLKGIDIYSPMIVSFSISCSSISSKVIELNRGKQ